MQLRLHLVQHRHAASGLHHRPRLRPPSIAPQARHLGRPSLLVGHGSVRRARAHRRLRQRDQPDDDDHGAGWTGAAAERAVVVGDRQAGRAVRECGGGEWGCGGDDGHDGCVGVVHRRHATLLMPGLGVWVLRLHLRVAFWGAIALRMRGRWEGWDGLVPWFTFRSRGALRVYTFGDFALPPFGTLNGKSG